LNHQHETYLLLDLSTVILMNNFFSTLGGERKQLEKNIDWNELSLHV